MVLYIVCEMAGMRPQAWDRSYAVAKARLLWDVAHQIVVAEEKASRMQAVISAILESREWRGLTLPQVAFDGDEEEEGKMGDKEGRDRMVLERVVCGIGAELFVELTELTGLY